MRGKIRLTVMPAFLLIVLQACTAPGTAPASPSATSAPATNTPFTAETPEATPTPGEPVNTETALAPSPTVEGGAGTLPEEAILILEPGPGSRLVSPLTVRGEADPTFEQNLVVRLVSAEGEELAQSATQIQADVGQRGPFEVELSFEVAEERQAFLQVYAASARDGGITHLASAGVTLAPSGEAEIATAEAHDERIVIYEPANNAEVTSGTAHVEGFALASFEQTLVVEVQDAEGNVIGSQAVIVQAPDLGVPGPFSADIPFQLESAGPGRIVARDPSPAFDGDLHLASVEVRLAP